jgi:hypothetical protein
MKFSFLAFTFFITFSICVLAQPSVHGDKYLSSLFETSLVFDTAHTLVPSFQQSTADVENIWKTWATVENFTFGKDRGALPMIADLNALHPYFRDRIVELIKACKEKGIDLAVVESFRTHAKQAEYFGMGRKYTRSAGGKSKHQYGLAVDVVPVINAVPEWDNVALWKKIGVIGEKLGLRWGGRWRAPYDPAHFEWASGITTHQLAYGIFPSIPAAFVKTYPSIKQDIDLLKTYWEAWETEQSSIARNAKSTQPAVVISSEVP